MSSDASDVNATLPARRRGRAIVGAAIVVVAVIVVVFGVLFVRDVRLQEPKFPSLAESPDRSLHGTVAYYATSGCVRIVAAAGRPSKDVLCLPKGQDVAKAQKLGKELGPQLVWRPDGRLEVTMFRMTEPPGPSFNPGWQKIVDVRTGAVEDVPAADVPSEANLTTHPTVSPSGQRITTSSDNGKVKIVLSDDAGSRTLLSVQGPKHYTYGLTSAFWAPDWRWIAADDGRILIVTTAKTRPVTLGQPFTHWSIRKLAEYLAVRKGRKVKVGRERLRQILIAEGITFQRTKTWKESPDPLKEEKLSRIEWLLEHRRDRTFAFDEFGPLTIKPVGGSAWAPRGKPVRRGCPIVCV